MAFPVVNPQAPGQVLWRKFGLILGDVIRASVVLTIVWATIWVLYFSFPA
jgi:hypothetical protein